MKKIALVVALSTALSSSAFAQNFVGVDVGVVSGYPDSTGAIVSGLIANGWTTASSTQKVTASSFKIHGGQWLTDSLGWEAGYADFGSVDGSSAASVTGGSYANNYKYTASTIYGAVLGAIQSGSSKWYAKAGLNAFSAKTEYTFSTRTSSGAGSGTKSGTGLLLGAGYEYAFNKNWAIRADITMFGVQFADVNNLATTKDQTMVQTAAGLNYSF